MRRRIPIIAASDIACFADSQVLRTAPLPRCGPLFRHTHTAPLSAPAAGRT